MAGPTIKGVHFGARRTNSGTIPMTGVPTDDVNLDFPGSVCLNFAFLETLGFTLSDVSSSVVRYERQSAFLEVFHDSYTFEIGVNLGVRIEDHKGIHEERFPLHSAIALAVDPASVGYRELMSSDPETTLQMIRKLAAWTRKYVEPLLIDTTAMIMQLRAQTEADAQVLTDGMSARSLRSEADLAWKQGDYSRVRDLYGRVSTELETITLTPVEQARLEYCKRHAR